MLERSIRQASIPQAPTTRSASIPHQSMRRPLIPERRTFSRRMPQLETHRSVIPRPST
jgi:hypothetical protein